MNLKVDSDLIDEIAKCAVVDPLSVQRRLFGIHVRGGAGARCDAELARRGITPGAVVVNIDPPAKAPPKAPKAKAAK